MQIHRVVVLLSLVAACSSNAASSPITTGGADTSSSSAPETSVADTGASTSGAPTSTPPTTAGTPTSAAGFTCLRTPAAWDDNVRLGDCDTSGYVRTIEDRLNVLGFPCTADNQFRADTDAAVRSFQASRGLAVDGQVGVNTWAALTEGGIGD